MRERIILDVKDGVPKNLREWARREGLEMAYRVEIDVATMTAYVEEYMVDADGKRYLDDTGESAATRVRTTRVSSLP